MPSRYPVFDRSKLRILPLDQRRNLVDLSQVLPLDAPSEQMDSPELTALADAIAAACRNHRSVVLLMGAHVIKQGLSRFVIDLIRRGWVSVVAMNGACSVHDFELASIGATSESVADYILNGQFGFWDHTARINEIVRQGNAQGLGYGEALGRYVSQSRLPHKDLSIFAAAYEAGVPATVHVGIGYDILHQHPNCDGAALGEASYRDFLIFTKVMENIEGGAVMCYGTAIMGPEVYLKALSMVRNLASQQGRSIRHFTSAVFDLIHLGGDLHHEAPKDQPEYYYRPFKTVLVRTVRDGGVSHYIRGDHRQTLPALHKLLCHRLGDDANQAPKAR